LPTTHIATNAPLPRARRRRLTLTPSYPQTEDELFDGHNLVSFDMRGHGLTAVDGLDNGFDMWSAAEDIKAGLVSAFTFQRFWGCSGDKRNGELQG
jgi:pimeloyl-ACP methyl ester carboxylesterase